MSRQQQEKIKTKPEFGKRGLVMAEPTERKPTPMERLKIIWSPWWRRYASHETRGAKLGRPRTLPQRRQ